MRLIFITVSVLLGFMAQSATAVGPVPKKAPALKPRQLDISGQTTAPIFGQLVAFSLPSGFEYIFEDVKNTQYLREAVLHGESVNKWSQMLTLTGIKGISENPDMTPQIYAETLAGGFKKVCPETFSGSGLGKLKVGIYDAFSALISCGSVKFAGASYSESEMLIVIKGEKDFYTVQWAERGSASNKPLQIDQDKWIERLKTLPPIKLCPIIPGETAPYPSCLIGGSTP